ncbi:MAG: PQQ-binding-like beta-propeller repeat protein, partial [Gammaproteobacteria bacterium]
ANGQVYVKTIDGKLTALTASNGQAAWTYDEGATELQLLGSSSAVVSGNTVVAGFSDGKVNAINANNGQLIWQTTVATPQGFSDVSQMVGIFANPVVYGGVVYVASYHGTVSALDLSSGHIIWQHPLSDYAGLAVNGDGVFAINTNGIIFAFSRDDGTMLWKQAALKGRQLSGTAIDDNNVVVGDNQGSLHWLSTQDGHFTARAYLGKSPIVVTPLVVSGNVIAMTQNGTVFVLRLSA